MRASPRLPVYIEGNEAHAVIDTGAEVNVIGSKLIPYSKRMQPPQDYGQLMEVTYQVTGQSLSNLS